MRKIIPLILSLFMILMLTDCSGNSNEPFIGGNTQTSSSSSGQTNHSDSSTNKPESNVDPVQSSSSNNSTSDTNTEPASSPDSSGSASSTENSKSESNSSTEPVSSDSTSSEQTSSSDSSESASNSSTETVSSDSTSSEQTSGIDNSTSETPSNTNSDEQPAEPQPEDTGKNVLVAYFSATGTTKALAEYAADAVNGDLYEIVPQQPYTSADLDYGDRNSRSTKEMDDPSCRPAINGSVSNMSQYDIVFIGYPIWWGEAPRIINTFVESYDFSGKTIVPFCTSGGSGMGSSARNLHSLTSNSAKRLDGARLSSGSSRGDMVSWINGLGLGINAE